MILGRHLRVRISCVRVFWRQGSSVAKNGQSGGGGINSIGNGKGNGKGNSIEKPRVNEVGIQYLSEGLQKKVFPGTSTRAYKKMEPAMLETAKSHLKHHGLWGKKTQISEPLNIENFPKLVGKSLDEHFYKLGMDSAEPYLTMASRFLCRDTKKFKLPSRPRASQWVFESGWTRYTEDGRTEKVPYPLEDELVFDVEVIYKRSPYAVICTCVTPKAWYGWVSPFLIEYDKDKKCDDWEHLIPLDCLDKPKLIVGYNVSYDRARVLEEYNVEQSQAFYLDGMALHVAVSGICSQQRAAWHKHKKIKSQLMAEETTSHFTTTEESEDAFDALILANNVARELLEDPWLDKGSPNSLANVADFHCDIKLDKSDRDYFSTEDPLDVIANFNNLMDYCASDVEATFMVTAKLLPDFRAKVPHPVSFAALRHLGTLMLPTTKKWDKYVENAERIYEENRQQVCKILEERANDFVRFIEKKEDSLKPDYENDPWLSQLNWTFKQPRLKKNGEPVANQAYLTGYPEWYRELFKTTTVDGIRQKEINITTRSRITPLLLKLKWEGYPLIWTDSAGWCFKVPFDEKVFRELESKNYKRAKLSETDLEIFLPQLRDNGNSYELFKVPHPEGPSKRCTSILSKSYFNYFEKGVLTSEYSFALEIVKLNTTASYWMGNRQRIMDQFVVYNDPTHKKNQFFRTKTESKQNSDMGIILPKLCTMGTITRRATENTWLTASNSKGNRIGSELKSLISAPPGYAFIGADVDSEELWIASLIGDSMVGIHGGTALGWMTLEGDKNQKTDLHSKTAEILGILRNDAKIFNYGRIYGAGLKFATRLLKQCNTLLSDQEAEELALALYKQTKGHFNGSKVFKRKVYHGGTESIIFNTLESIAYRGDPRTPTLGASITDALTAKNLNKNNYLTSRINWAIQSSGVDYLHLLIISMEFLLKKYKIDARLMLTVHDELRYMAKETDKYTVALLLQVSNLWTRAMFCEQLGIQEVPQSCAFFSEVDIDHVLRKEVTQDCVTPSHPDPIPPGESYDIRSLLKKCEDGRILGNRSTAYEKRVSSIPYSQRPPSIDHMKEFQDFKLQHAMVKLQNSVDKGEWIKNLKVYANMKKKLEENQGETTSLSEETGAKVKKKTTRKATSSGSRTRRKNPKLVEYDISSDGDQLLEEELGKAVSRTPSLIPEWPQKPERIDKISSGTLPTKQPRYGAIPWSTMNTSYHTNTVASRNTSPLNNGFTRKVSLTTKTPVTLKKLENIFFGVDLLASETSANKDHQFKRRPSNATRLRPVSPVEAKPNVRQLKDPPRQIGKL